MTLVLDSGALVALERNERAMWRRFKAEELAGRVPVTHGGVLAQVWRGGRDRQAPLARALRGIDVVPLDEAVGRAAGALLGRTGGKDAIDAALVAIAADEDRIVTSDPADIRRLVAASRRHTDVVRP